MSDARRAGKGAHAFRGAEIPMAKILHFSTLLATASLLVSGCVLPVPHRRMHTAGIEARVVDAKTALPVPGAKVSSTFGSRILSTVDSQGDFEIPAQYGWHGAYLIGPISYSLLPHFATAYPRPPFRIEAIGYQSMIVQPYDDVNTDERTGKAMIRLQPK